MTQPSHYPTLKARHREIRDEAPQNASLRIHRALSWLERAEQETDDADARFVFLWVAFNAAYAREFEDRAGAGERELLRGFLGELAAVDGDKRLYQLLWKRFTGPIRLLIDNRYVFQPFWDYANGRIPEAAWQDQFRRDKRKAHAALGRHDTVGTLAIVFDRLYTLRNQLLHGGATWNSGVNRRQVEDGAAILSDLVPAIIALMMEHPEHFRSDPCYPVMD